VPDFLPLRSTKSVPPRRLLRYDERSRTFLDLVHFPLFPPISILIPENSSILASLRREVFFFEIFRPGLSFSPLFPFFSLNDLKFMLPGMSFHSARPFLERLSLTSPSCLFPLRCVLEFSPPLLRQISPAGYFFVPPNTGKRDIVTLSPPPSSVPPHLCLSLQVSDVIPTCAKHLK